MIKGQAVSPHSSASPSTDIDRAFMMRAFELGRLGVGRTWPNPIVGAVVVSGGREIASGYHARLGDPHAEAVAIEAAGTGARGATLYVSLEPCAHHGHTPPCVDRVCEAGISRVVFPALDPDPRVNGNGAEVLRSRGVRVDAECEAASGVVENLGYYHARLGVSSTVTLKMAMSADGMAARERGRRDDITGDVARRDVHQLRALHDAVVVGAETARVDQPLLDCRFLDGGLDRIPVPVVLDTRLRTPADNAWSRSGRAFVVVTGPHIDEGRVRDVERAGGRVIRCDPAPGGVDVRHAVERLAETGLSRILVEGGPSVLASFLRADAWDAWWCYRSAVEFGAGVSWFDDGTTTAGGPGVFIDEVAVGDDVRRRHVNPRSWDRLTALRSRGRG